MDNILTELVLKFSEACMVIGSVSALLFLILKLYYGHQVDIDPQVHPLSKLCKQYEHYRDVCSKMQRESMYVVGFGTFLLLLLQP